MRYVDDVKGTVEEVYVPGRELLSVYYNCLKQRRRMIERWLGTFSCCEIVIRPAYKDWDADEPWSGRARELSGEVPVGEGEVIGGRFLSG
jgi:hypothetical protein